MTDSKDNKQLKFIEILLIVGGIIGGLGSDKPLIKVILAWFLITSLMYYNAVSNRRSGELFALLTSTLFAVLITYPILSGTPLGFWNTYPKANKYLIYIMAILLFYTIYENLGEKAKSGRMVYYIFGMIFTLGLLLYVSTV